MTTSEGSSRAQQQQKNHRRRRPRRPSIQQPSQATADGAATAHETTAAPRAASDAPTAQGVFADLIAPLQRAIADAGYREPTPIQAEAIPHLLAGQDLLATAQTGSGKTAAFTLPMLQHLVARPPKQRRGPARALIVAPTRELAAQIDDCIRTYGRHLPLRHVAIYGGVGQRPQVEAIRRGVDVIVATPGRLLDLMQQRVLRLDQVELFVLDEVDRMLDMGFIHDIRKIIAALPRERQSLFFSATMAPEAAALARTLVRNPVRVAITPDRPAVERIQQRVMFVEKKDKGALLTTLLRDPTVERGLVFTRLKYMANRVASRLEASGISAAAIHGNKSQLARTRALSGFKSGKIRVLVATDIAARGIDVEGITHVINHDLPDEPETYVHRIGRTARAGAEGSAISLCTSAERGALRDIERLIKAKIQHDTTTPHQAAGPPAGGSQTPRPERSRQAEDTPRSRRKARPRRTGRPAPAAHSYARGRGSHAGGRASSPPVS